VAEKVVRNLSEGYPVPEQLKKADWRFWVNLIYRPPLNCLTKAGAKSMIEIKISNPKSPV